MRVVIILLVAVISRALRREDAFCDTTKEFECAPGECIPPHLVCDSNDDCTNGEDENATMCQPICSQSMFNCNTSDPWSGCLNMFVVCDGNPDCDNGMDEDWSTCETFVCEEDEFKCNSSGNCISSKYKLCDGLPDCEDGSDEDKGFCESYTCPEQQIKCNSTATCVQELFVCDNVHNCEDGSDEERCEHKECQTNEFRCNETHSCILAFYLCDGIEDCSDGTDEIKKLCESVPCYGHWCGSGFCLTGRHFLCNGRVNCNDGSDESPALGCPLLACEENQFKCANQRCVSIEQHCDLTDDCGDGSDEPDTCDYQFCGDEEFRCSNGECIESALRCDDIIDCSDTSDEWNCTCASSTDFWCRNGACIEPSLVCDGLDDCGDASDEQLEYCSQHCLVDLTSKLYDFQLTASSYEKEFPPKHGLYMQSSAKKWCPDRNDTHPYLQVDFLDPVKITHIKIYNWLDGSSIDTAILKNRLEEITLKHGNYTEEDGLVDAIIVHSGASFSDEALAGSSTVKFVRAYDVNIMARFLRVSVSPSSSDVCLTINVVGCGATVYIDFYPVLESIPLDIYEVESVIVSDESSIPMAGIDTAMECQELCITEISCRATVFSVENGMCFTYGDNFSDMPRQIRASQENMIFQKLYKTGLWGSKKNGTQREIIEETVLMYPALLTFPYFVLEYDIVFDKIWYIDFSAIRSFPMLMFEDFGNWQYVKYTFHAGSTWMKKSARQGMFVSHTSMMKVIYRPLEISSAEKSPRAVSTQPQNVTIELLKQINQFRMFIIASALPSLPEMRIHSLDIRQFYTQGFIYSDAFLGFTSPLRSDYIIEVIENEYRLPFYTTLEFKLFHISCDTGTTFKIKTRSSDIDYCNLDRPPRNLTFTPFDLPIELSVFYNVLGNDRPIDGIEMYFSLERLSWHTSKPCSRDIKPAYKKNKRAKVRNWSKIMEIRQHKQDTQYVLVSGRNDIKLVNLQNSEDSTTVISGVQALALTILYEENLLFWNQYGETAIYRANLTSGEVKIIPIYAGIALACDWIGRKLYWQGRSSNMIVGDLDGQIRRVLYWLDGEASSIAVDPLHGYLYWSERHPGKVVRASMDGRLSSVEVLVKDERGSKNFDYIESITLDYETSRIYFSTDDRWFNAIYSCSVNGRNCEKHFDLSYRSANHLTVYGDKLCVVFYNKILNKMNKHFGNDTGQMMVSSYIKEVEAYLPGKPREGHPCNDNNGGCSDLCLISSEEPFYRCACASGVALLPDQKTCACPEACTKNFCYRVYSDRDDFGTPMLNFRTDAERICKENHQGNLASIASLEELRFVRSHAESVLMYKFATRDGISTEELDMTDRIYLGNIVASGLTEKQMFHWSDGIPVIFNAWSQSVTEVRDGCIVMKLWETTDDNVLDYHTCNDRGFYYVCKYSKNRTDDGEPMHLPTPDKTDSVDNNTHFTCGSGEILSQFAVCDNNTDCTDNSDEIACQQDDCTGMFMCEKGYECVPYSMYCDFFEDCKDGSDESGCDFGDPDFYQFRCNSGQMVAIRSECNATFECLDKSDELNCEECSEYSERKLTPCAKKWDCVPADVVQCNGFDNCPHFEAMDEQDCLPEVIKSCFTFWEWGYRKSKFYKLTDKTDTATVECNFDMALSSGIIKTTFSNIDFDSSGELWKYRDADRRVMAQLRYQSHDLVKMIINHSYGKGYHCEQTFIQTCLSNRRTIADNLDLKHHPEYYDCLCITLTLVLRVVNEAFQSIPSLSACSPGTQRLVDEGYISLKDAWRYGGIDKADTYLFMTTYVTRSYNSLSGNASLFLGPITCTDKQSLKAEDGVPFIRPELPDGTPYDPSNTGNSPVNPSNTPVDPEISPVNPTRSSKIPGNIPAIPSKTLDQGAAGTSFPSETGGTMDYSVDFACGRGRPIPKSMVCLYDYDEWGFIRGCADLSHLQNCENAVCPEKYVKCPNSFCIAVRHFCDGQVDCPSGEDEKHCMDSENRYSSCNGYFRCMNTSICLPQSQVCDSKVHCPLGDDERLCNFKCPASCLCQGYKVTCKNMNQTDVDRVNVIISANTRFLDISSGSFSQPPAFDLKYLGFFNLSNGRIIHVPETTFRRMQNLLILDLSQNLIRILQKGSFVGLRKLQSLILHRNEHLHSIEPGTFEGLSTIEHLKISNTKIRHLKKNTFVGLNLLRSLDLTFNDIAIVNGYSFDHLFNLKELDISRNDISNFQEEIFSGLDNLENLHTDSYVFCCLKPDSVARDRCTPLPDAFSSCKDLMGNEAARSLIWVIGMFALAGNFLSLLYRVIFERERFQIGYGVFVTNLTFADFLMGLYLLIIAGADTHYRDRYIWNERLWRESRMCNLAGVLSTVSAEASVLFICFITLDRILVVKYPFGGFKFTTKIASSVCFVLWMAAILVSIIPLFYTNYFRDSFYSTNAVCLPLPLTNDKPPGWEYAVGVFVFFNFVAFLFIACGQYAIFQEIQKTAMAAGKKKRLSDMTVARNLLMVVATDFLAWCPIAVLGLMALAGVEISAQVYVWTTVLILPINSALNPFMYTLLNILRRKKLTNPKEEDQTFVAIDVLTVQKSILSGQIYGLDADSMTQLLSDRAITLEMYYMNSPGILPNHAVRLVWQLTKQISCLHDMGLHYGNIDAADVKVACAGTSVVAVGMCNPPKVVKKMQDTPRDVNSLGLIAHKLVNMCIQDKKKEFRLTFKWHKEEPVQAK